MRFKLTLHIDRRAAGEWLPLSYQYELSAFVYRAIARADSDYSAWLHENGFRLDGKPFKLFTFSHFDVPKYLIDKENGRMRIDCDRVTWQASFLPEKSTEKFVMGLFAEQTFQIGDRLSAVQFRIERIEALPSPDFAAATAFRTLSPVCIPFQSEEYGKVTYLMPDAPEVPAILLNNLLHKYESFYGRRYEGSTDFDFRLLSRPRSKLIRIKAHTLQQTDIRGYDFDFHLQAAPALLKIMYEAGLGAKNSVGFGMVALNTPRPARNTHEKFQRR